MEEPIFINACRHIKKHKLNIVFETNKLDGLKIDFLAKIKKLDKEKIQINQIKHQILQLK